MDRQFEEFLAFHCAPAMAGIKGGNLVSCPRQLFRDPHALIRQYALSLSGCGIRLRVLCSCPKAVLLLVYREGPLSRCLAHPEARRLLQEAGYPDGPLPQLLDHLCGRMGRQGEFPHEIGLFLGYPPVDVAGFQRYKGKNCKLCGHWKVYGDPVTAARTFQRYDRCRFALCRRVRQGHSLAQLFCAA